MKHNLWTILAVLILVSGCKKNPTPPMPLKKQVQQLRRDFGILGNSIVVNLEDDNETINISFENDMLFEFGKYNVKDESKDGLNILTNFLKKYPSFNVIIEGHTDSIGDPKENQILSENRALAVADILIENNISAQRISSIGYGEERPKYDNSTEDGRSLNRRAEIKLKKAPTDSIFETTQPMEIVEETIVMDDMESDNTITEEPKKSKKVKGVRRGKNIKKRTKKKKTKKRTKKKKMRKKRVKKRKNNKKIKRHNSRKRKRRIKQIKREKKRDSTNYNRSNEKEKPSDEILN